MKLRKREESLANRRRDYDESMKRARTTQGTRRPGSYKKGYRKSPKR